MACGLLASLAYAWVGGVGGCFYALFGGWYSRYTLAVGTPFAKTVAIADALLMLHGQANI